jgi:predicted flavoprotein YhiN
MKVIIVGGGPAGMMAAIVASREGNEVTLIEKNNILGKKLLITGKGRCNITNNTDISEFMDNIPGNPKFMYSCFHEFSNKDVIKFFN